MFGRLKKIFLLTLFASVVGAQFYFSGAVFAEDVEICSGMITGTTIDGGNAGRSYFDAHGGPNQGVNAQYYNNVVDLAVFGLGQGLAPGERANAACVEKAAAPGSMAYGEEYEYLLRGYVFNDNLGFISFNCEAGFNDAGEGNGVACGGIDYGVYLSPVGPDGTRKLFGYGWNPAFGWINFNELPLNWDVLDPQPGAIIYDVRREANGVLSGNAWNDAQVLMPFNGARMFLPDEEPVVPVVNDPENWCNGKPYLCVMVDPYPEKLKFGFEEGAQVGVDEMKVADGTDGYNVHLYLRNENGDGPLNQADYNFDAFKNGIRLRWTDTVKIDQTSDVQRDYFDKRYPWREVNNPGAVKYKPLNFTDFVPVAGDPGHYVSSSPVSSYAPTSDGNLSLTSGTNPIFPFRNEQFVHDLGLAIPAPNDLILNSITFDVPLIANAGNVTVLAPGAVYPNGKVGMSMKFRPPVEVNTLYADDFQDKIVAYRAIPMNFRVGARKWGVLAALNSAKVDFNLQYSEVETQNQPLCLGVDADFDFHFLTDLTGNALPDASSDGPNPVVTVNSFPNVNAMSLIDTEKDIQAKATLPSAPESPCATVAAPTMYTMVHYLVAANKPEVKYYSNKLPRISGDFISNPAVVVHGNVFAQMVREIQKDVLVQTSGSVNVNIVRDTINENLEKYLSSSRVLRTGKLCTIRSLAELGGPAPNYEVQGCALNTDYVKMVIGDEQVLYFKGSVVAMDLRNKTFSGKWVIVNADGNIFVDRDIYNDENSPASLSLVAFRSNVPDKFFITGNVYLAPCLSGLKNIQATIIADGSVFSYNGSKIMGNPGDVGVGIDDESGEPVWGSYASMVGSLGCQLLIEGAIYSDNTIGGADLDSGDNPKKYLLLGGGKIVPADGGENTPITLNDRMRAQYYDLNYLRMFRQSIEITADGLPKDQQCGKGLTNEDVRRIAVGEVICGAIEPCDPDDENSDNICNGIDIFNPVSRDGDLVTPRNSDALALGLKNGLEGAEGADFDPVYIFYKAPSKDSFLFSKAGVVDLGGR